MLRVLTLSTLFPDAARPNFGVFVERQTLELARAGAEVEVAAGVGMPPWPLSLHPHYRKLRDLPRKEAWNGLEVHRPQFRVLPGLPRHSARALAESVLPIARESGAAVIDAEFFWPDGVAAMHVSRAAGIPFSVKARGSDIHFWGQVPQVRRQMVEAAREAGALLSVSEALKRSMAELGMPEEKIRVHHAGVDLELFRPGAGTKQALGVEGPLLVSAGALIPLKGQALAIEALAELPGATLLLVGDGPERERLERLARSLGVAERAHFLGSRPHEELPALLAAADIMVLPSEREGLANVWLEALACGTPVVISDVGGAREVVDQPEAGRLAAREPRAIAEAVREILAAPPAREAVRNAAERFSWSRNGETLAAHLARVANCGDANIVPAIRGGDGHGRFVTASSGGGIAGTGPGTDTEAGTAPAG